METRDFNQLMNLRNKDIPDIWKRLEKLENKNKKQAEEIEKLKQKEFRIFD